MRPYPSGAQHEIRHGDQRAVVVEVGGGVREYTVAGRPVLDGYPPEEICGGARGTPLIPWPNRLADGRYRFAGADHQLPLTEPAAHNAIHGLTRWDNWNLRESATERVVLGTVVAPRPGYPWRLDVAVDYRLDADGLTVRTTATNLGDDPCPYGAGQHPYLTVGAARIDGCTVHLDAARVLLTDDRGLPTRTVEVDGTEFDLRRPRTLGDTRIDNAYTDLARDARGRAWLTLGTDGGPTVRLWVDERHPWLEIYTGDTLPVDRRRQGLGVEPMTCPPNAFASGTDLVVLESGGSVTTSWGIQPG
jgi:aldose 1-epimerase